MSQGLSILDQKYFKVYIDYDVNVYYKNIQTSKFVS